MPILLQQTKSLMKQTITSLRTKYLKANDNLRKALLETVKQFLHEKGVLDRNKNVHILKIDDDISDFVDIPYVLVETDRHFCEMGMERVQIITLNDKEELSVETTSDCLSEPIVITPEWLSIYDFFISVEDNIKDGTLKIDNGKITLSEKIDDTCSAI